MQTKEEESGAQYQHPENVQRQIATLPLLGSEVFWLRASILENGSEAQLTAETLVYCLRQFLVCGDVVSARRVAELLLTRSRRTVLKQAWNWFRTLEEDRNDMRQEVYCQLWKELCDPRERYWEVRFYHALKCLCYDVATRLSRPLKKEVAWPHYVDEEGELVKKDIEDPSSVSLDERIFVEQILGRLDEPIRTAIYLRIIEEWPIHSKDSSALTIASVLGVTDRTVRNYLNRGLNQLRVWFIEKEAEHATAQ